jgi:hypothetical protein
MKMKSTHIYMYKTPLRFVLALLYVLVFVLSQNTIFAQSKNGVKPVQPIMLEDANPVKSEPARSTSTGKEQVLFHSKALIEKEKQFHALRSTFSSVNGNGIIDDAIRSMYVPFKNDAIMCDFSVNEDFDKSTVPADLSKSHAYLLEYFSQEELNELNFCLNYIGIQAVDQDFFLFYVLPYKNHIRFFKQNNLSGRDLAWFVAIDLRQTVCQKQQTLIVKDALLKPVQVRTN